jgi:S-adenosyl methyltransferase
VIHPRRIKFGRATRYLAGEAGLRQFLDIGTGIPAAGNTHEVAQRVAPDARVVYVDNDPIVLLHAQALLRGTPEGATGYLQADLRDPGAILQVYQWRPGPGDSAPEGAVSAHGAVARKPGA